MAQILTGIRVFDLTVAVVGPWAAKLLSALGADVIKVEEPTGERISHGIQPQIKGTSCLYIAVHHNKRHITLDLKCEEGRAAALNIIGKSDIFLENLRPGSVERMGLTYEQVAQVNPRILYVSASAYGESGPLANEAGHDVAMQAFSGWSSINGQAGGLGEVLRYFGHLDLTTSSVLVQSILQGLIARERTGKGQRIEVDMVSAALAIQASRLAEYFSTGVQPRPMGSATSTTVPHQAFRCQDQKYIAVGVVREEQWPGFCRAVGLENLASNPRFSTNRDRVEHRAELIPYLEQRFQTKPLRWWTIRLSKERVPHGPFLEFDVLRHHPQVVQNNYLLELNTPHWGTLYTEGLPWSFDRTPAGPIRPGGLIGEHTAEVLAELGSLR